MKRLFTIFFALLLGITAAFAQTQPTLPYQAVVRDNQNHLLKDADVRIDVQIYEGTTLRYSETQTPHSNANGLISFNIGAGSGATGNMADVADWRVAKFKFTYHLTDGDVVVTDSVHAVPYALQTAFATGGNFLTSDSAVITTMQGNITTNTTDIAALADRVNTFNTNVCDSVKNCDFSGNASIQGVLQELSDLISAQNHKIDSLGHIVDSLSNLPHGGGTAATFTCGTDSIKDFDNNWYHTVKIGEQCWMKENLRTKSYANGTGIELSSNTSKETAYRYYPNGQESYVSTYGYLYNWKAVMDTSSSSDANPSGVQGVCPEGWHVPSKAEFQTLMNYCSDHYAAGGDGGNNAKALADTTNWSSSSYSNAIGNNLSANNQSGFSALPAGNYGGSYYGFRSYAYFWSSTPDGEYNAYYMTLNNDRSDARLESFSRLNGRSVRCLRDAGVGGTPGSNETAGTTPSAPATMSCEQVMECMGDTLGKLNTKIEEQGTEIETLNGTVTSQGQTIETLNSTVQSQGQTITTQGQTIDSLAHIVDSLSNLTPGGGNTPAAAFTCGTDKVKDVENNEYNTVLIGEQCWMKENLRTKTSAYGNVWTNPGVDSTIYGRYYDWAAVMQNESGDKVRGICPEGWHVPSDAEWTALTDYVNAEANGYRCNGDGDIANALSQPTGWHNTSTGCNAGNTGDKANATGFSAVPAGICDEGSFDYFSLMAYFWSATEDDNDDGVAWTRYLVSDNSYVDQYNDFKGYGFSVRCLRDAGVGGGDTPDTPGGGETAIVDTVVCYPNLGSNDSVKKTVTRGQDLDLSTTFTHPVETNNWEIASWNTKADGTGTSYTNTLTTSGNLTLYAQWRTFCTGTPSSANEVGSGRIDTLKDVDNNKYAVVQIGSQCWMAVNLRTTHYADNTPITLGTTSNKSTEVGYYYDYSSDDPSIPLEQRGYLYNWPAAMKSTSNPEGTQGICPTGWHLPTKAEWQTMVANADASTLTGAVYLSASRYWNGSNPATDGMTPNSYDNPDRNKSGFSAVPAGFFNSSSFDYSGNNADFWSSSPEGSYAWCRYLDSGNTSVRENKLSKKCGYSVRCVRD